MNIPLILLVWFILDAVIVLALLIARMFAARKDAELLYRDSGHNHHHRRL